MWYLDYNTEQEAPVLLLTSLGSSIVGAVAGDITFYFKKNGASSWTSKTLNASTWRESGSGIYYVTFSASDTDTYGTFLWRATHASGYAADVAEITDYATEAALLQDIYDLIATKANKSDISDRERALDNQLDALAKAYSSQSDAISHLQMQIAALKARIAAL